MSLPVGHGLVGCMVLAASGRRVDFCRRRTAWLLALSLPVIPDFDFALVWFLDLPPAVWHRTYTHSLLFAVLCGGVAALWVKRRGQGTPRAAFLFVGALVLSHAVLDMFGLGGDGGPGRGVALFWPMSLRVASPWQMLPPGTRRDLWGLLDSGARELLWLGPPTALAWAGVWARRRLGATRGRRPR